MGAYVSCLSGFQGILKPAFFGRIDAGFACRCSIMFSVRVCVRFPVGGFVKVFVLKFCVWTSGGVSVRICAEASVRVLERSCIVSCAVPVRISGGFVVWLFFSCFLSCQRFCQSFYQGCCQSACVSPLLRALFSKFLSRFQSGFPSSDLSDVCHSFYQNVCQGVFQSFCEMFCFCFQRV